MQCINLSQHDGCDMQCNSRPTAFTAISFLFWFVRHIDHITKSDYQGHQLVLRFKFSTDIRMLNHDKRPQLCRSWPSLMLTTMRRPCTTLRHELSPEQAETLACSMVLSRCSPIYGVPSSNQHASWSCNMCRTMLHDCMNTAGEICSYCCALWLPSSSASTIRWQCWLLRSAALLKQCTSVLTWCHWNLRSPLH